MQEVSLAILKKLDFPATGRRPFRLRELDPALFKFGPGISHCIHAQGDVPKTRELIVSAILRHAVGGINLEPSATGKADQNGGRLLAVIKNFTRAQDALIPGFQPNGIW